MNDHADTYHEIKSELNQEEEENLIPNESPPEQEKNPLDLLQSEFDDLNDKYLRLAADFENFRRRTTRDTEQRIAQSIGQFARDMLEVADSLDQIGRAHV